LIPMSLAMLPLRWITAVREYVQYICKVDHTKLNVDFMSE